jgi:hypothetical protein
MIEGHRLWRVLRLAFAPTPSIATWAGWWPQATAAVLWIVGALGIGHVRRLHLGTSWGVALVVAGAALLFLVAAYRLQPAAERERRDYAELFLSMAGWRGAILLLDPELDGVKITAWTNPITNFLSDAYGKLEADRFIAPESPATPGPPGSRPGTGNVLAYQGRLVDLCNRFQATPMREFDLASWRRTFLVHDWRFTFAPAPALGASHDPEGRGQQKQTAA